MAVNRWLLSLDGDRYNRTNDFGSATVLAAELGLSDGLRDSGVGLSDGLRGLELAVDLVATTVAFTTTVVLCGGWGV